jgi:hypothetical protein
LHDDGHRARRRRPPLLRLGLVGWDWDWFWLFVAVLLDLGGAASSGYANRDRMPGYSTGPAPIG